VEGAVAATGPLLANRTAPQPGEGARGPA
jgi:hypothetical protein